jgi:hydroxymethylpyrimidine pyrophosphatase-like HAD family hydrolase
MYSGTRAIALEIGIRGPVACIDGSHIVEVATDRELHARYIESDALAPLIHELRAAKLASFAFADDTVLHDDDGLPFLAYVSTWSRRAQTLPSVLDAEAFRGRSVSAVVALGIADAVEATASFVRTLLSDALPSEVVAVGDWLNDIPMLRVAGRSFVMAQAPDEVKAVATDELEADFVSGGGIAEAADRAGLL